MLGEIVESAVSAEPDMHIVGMLEPFDVADPARWPAADAAIVGLEKEDDIARLQALLRLRPELKLLVLTRDGRRGFLYRLLPSRADLGELSPTRLVQALRCLVESPPSDGG